MWKRQPLCLAHINRVLVACLRSSENVFSNYRLITSVTFFYGKVILLCLFLADNSNAMGDKKWQTMAGWNKEKIKFFVWFFVVFLKCKQTAQQCCQKVWGKSSQILETPKDLHQLSFEITSSKLFQKEKISSSKHKGIKSKLVLNRFLTISLKVAKK